MKKHNKLLALLLALAMTFTMAVPVMVVEAEDGIMTISAVPEDVAGKTVILHTNDVHGAIDGYAKAAALEASTFCTPTSVGGFPQIGGMNITIDTTREFAQGDLYPDSTYHAPASVNRVTIDSVNGSAFSLTDTYAVVSNDFCAAGGDTYYAFSTATVMDTGTPLDEAVMQYITTVLKGTVDERYANPAGRITVIASEATEPEQSEPTTSSIYVVIRGDSLWRIAQKEYGSGSLWFLIYEANQDTVSDPSRIWVGQTLNIPAR